MSKKKQAVHASSYNKGVNDAIKEISRFLKDYFDIKPFLLKQK